MRYRSQHEGDVGAVRRVTEAKFINIISGGMRVRDKISIYDLGGKRK